MGIVGFQRSLAEMKSQDILASAASILNYFFKFISLKSLNLMEVQY